MILTFGRNQKLRDDLSLNFYLLLIVNYYATCDDDDDDDDCDDAVAYLCDGMDDNVTNVEVSLWLLLLLLILMMMMMLL
jgi:hypothetical protein